ncbi:MAG: carbamoyltransferase [Candidatus Sumerlaeota bacterium]
MTAILGISAFYHDSAAALVVDGEIVAAAQEERFTRKKHDHDFPKQAVDFCLGAANLAPSGIDFVAFYDKPLLKFERLLETYVAFAPAGFRSFLQALPLWLKHKLHLPREMRAGLGGEYKRRFLFTQHHESHAASAFFPSPYAEAAILTLDGVGEWATASMGCGRGNEIKLTQEMRFPHSLGLLYSAFTYYCGFKVNSGEYKLMGLAPYGEPIYADLIRSHLMDLKEDGSFRLDLSYFNYCQGLTMTSRKFHELLGGPPRKPDRDALSERHMNIAASIQAVTEEIMLRCARTAHRLTGMKNLCMAGGVALNCVGNGRLLREGPFESIWIQPAAGDAGGALGAALFAWHQLLGNPRTAGNTDTQRGSLLGPRSTTAEVEAFLLSQNAKFTRIDDEKELIQRTARMVDEGLVVGWFCGAMEFGPRALGARSILGDARSAAMQSTINLKTKFRESFRPFAPIVLREKVQEWFALNVDSPYMLIVAPVAEAVRIQNAGEELKGLEKLKSQRSKIPAVTHVNYSARVQTVDAERSPRLHKLLSAFEKRTGCPIMINTSFNVRGEPIVCTPEDAWRTFAGSQIDALVMENCIAMRADQDPALFSASKNYSTQFAPD